MSETQRARILLVDDDPKLTFVLRAHLTAAGYVAEEASDAESALAALPDFQPDVVVMDVGLPGMNGIEATQRIKENADTADVAVIMLTARTDTDHVVLALEAGAHEYIVKPFEIAELLARIRTVHRLRQTRLELDNVNDQLTTQVEERTGRLRTLYHFTRSLNEAGTRNEIMDLVIDAVRQVTGSQRVSILLKDTTRDELRCARAVGIDSDVVRRIRVPTGEGIAGQVFLTGKTYVASTIECEGDSGGPYVSDSFVSTPLIATSLMTSEENLGVLSITDKAGGGRFEPEEVECIRSIADSGAIALHNQIHRERLDQSVNVLLMTVGRLSEYRDNETGNHLERVRLYARVLTRELQSDPEYRETVNEEFIENIHRAAAMHDIGKIGVPDEILCKPGKLTADEYRSMQDHCRIGRDVIESAMTKTGRVPILMMCMEIAGSHHERWQGDGYPDGLAGEAIPLSARIIALADAYDAITSKRRYKDASGHDQAVEIIRSDAGEHFDPTLVDAFLRCAGEFDEIRDANADIEQTSPATTVQNREAGTIIPERLRRPGATPECSPECA